MERPFEVFIHLINFIHIIYFIHLLLINGPQRLASFCRYLVHR